MEMGIRGLWYNGNEENWEKALDIYRLKVSDADWYFETKTSADEVKNMGGKEFYDFLKNYYAWKYKGNYLSSRQQDLSIYNNEDGIASLICIKDKLFQDFDAKNTDKLLQTVMEINGLGVAGASGLLAILFPNNFGTVDKFVIMALKEIYEFPKALDITENVEKMKPYYIRIEDAVTLETILRMKANQLNETFGSLRWNPKRIDMVLWAYRAEQKDGWNRIVFGQPLHDD